MLIPIRINPFSQYYLGLRRHRDKILVVTVNHYDHYPIYRFRRAVAAIMRAN
ncbi:hypothetical protein CRENPOLYSF1_50170 [Crenothrix polyspora]|uniref:Transposase n=1 Tax=Crenothrix polyspora TaxID=360316 RepID=A0A1R4HDA3_9GAMM|nr:hypothetical protein CRENPOLYSF1_50170 [Crenothrix polyspora]